MTWKMYINDNNVIYRMYLCQMQFCIMPNSQQYNINIILCPNGLSTAIIILCIYTGVVVQRMIYG